MKSPVAGTKSPAATKKSAAPTRVDPDAAVLETLDDASRAGAVEHVMTDHDAAAFVGVGLRAFLFDLADLVGGKDELIHDGDALRKRSG